MYTLLRTLPGLISIVILANILIGIYIVHDVMGGMLQ